MSDRIESVFIGTAGLALAAFVALYLAIARSAAASEPAARDRLVRLVALAIAVEALHFVEELTTGFQRQFPHFLGLTDWTTGFFVTFNVAWFLVWIVSAFALRPNYAWAYFPIWFLGIGMLVNGIVHPFLALASGRYFPGLLTSPFAGVLGAILLRRLWVLTQARWW